MRAILRKPPSGRDESRQRSESIKRQRRAWNGEKRKNVENGVGAARHATKSIARQVACVRSQTIGLPGSGIHNIGSLHPQPLKR